MGGTGIAEGKTWSVVGGVDGGGPREAHLLLLRLLDGGDLLRHHRQHLDIDAIELIEAGPGPSTEGRMLRGDMSSEPPGTSKGPR